MLYRILQVYIPLAAKVYCRKVFFEAREKLPQKGPLIIAANHPNTFLDAIIIGLRFRQPVYFLARGDAFHNGFAEKILKVLHVIPIYRLSEGKEYLGRNQSTFERCRNILKKGGIVLIFSEGQCENEWKLRPLMKGTARLAIDCWNDEKIGAQLRVIPFGLNYHSYQHIGKVILLRSGQLIYKNDIDFEQGFGGQVKAFNQQLEAQLSELVLQVEDDSWQERQRQLFSRTFYHVELAEPDRMKILGQFGNNLSKSTQDAFKKNIFPVLRSRRFFFVNLLMALVTFLPALTGCILNAPFYFPLRNIVKTKTKNTVFYDGVFFGLLVLLYPFYLLAFSIILYLSIGEWWCWLIWLVAPVCGWYAIYFKQLISRLKLFFQ